MQIFSKIVEKKIDILQAVCYYSIRKEVTALSRRKKKNGNQTDRLTSKINLVAAILNLVAILLILLERLIE